MNMPTREKSATKGSSQRRPPAPTGPHRMTAAAREHVRQTVESPGCTNMLLKMTWIELELVTAERDAALARLGETDGRA